jgi:NAD(P)H-nitrite reductase large subunit
MARRHVLIGTGPGAISAAETIRGQDASAEIVVVGAEPHGYYSRPGLAYYLAREVPQKALFPFTAGDFARLDIRLLVARATAIDPAGHRVTLEGGRQLPYDRLLVATGSTANAVKVPGAQLDGVVKLDDMDDARDLIARSSEATRAVVVGGGITALEIVEGLRARKVHVHYFMRKERYWGNVLSEAESHIVENGLRARGVEIHYFTELAAILGRGGQVAGVETAAGERIDCDVVAIAIGVHPVKELAEEAGLECARGVLVDEHLRSSDPDIFAAGDIAEALDPASGRRDLEVLWNSAVVKGRVAGWNMATEPARAYDRTSPLNVTRLAGFKLTIMGTVGSGHDSDLEGIARGDSETWRHLGEASVIESQVDGAHVRLALARGMIAGAVVMGDQALSFPVQELIGAHAELGSVAEALQAPDAPIAELIDSAWQDWRARRV